MVNLLVLASGQRRYVVQELLKTKPSAGTVWSCDMDRLTPGVSLPGVRPKVQPEGAAADWLPDFCRREGVDAVLSLHDYQAIEVSALGDDLAAVGTTWIGPSPEVAATLLDKHRLALHLAQFGDLAIPTFLAGDHLPNEDRWIVKDRLGSGSSGLGMGLTREQALACLTSANVVAQPHQAGQEWNIDFFVRPGGAIEGFSAKRKIRMRGGETDAAEVFPASDVPFDVERVLSAFRGIEHLGNVDVDVFVHGEVVRVIDVNPRFGGGYAFSVRAGYAAAEAVWALAAGKAIQTPIQAIEYFRGAKSIEVVPL